MIRVALFEDIKEIRELLSETIENSEGLLMTGAYANANDALKVMKRDRPDVVLMDIQMPGISGIEAVRTIKASFPEIQILMQTVFEDNARIFAAICAGASGYILKDASPERYLDAIIEVAQGGAPMSPVIARKVLTMFQGQNTAAPKEEYHELSPTEQKVLGCLVRGLSYKLIADECKISISTVNFHLKNIYRKLHVNSATEAISKALRQQLTSL
ncbi:response regulator [Runella aurantiaca]|uniref:DNA-binding response regulator n=1 Tax=Runella aurantiaca TaxID=2282308 RepID=A0A369IE82_9BACT|nr:response regulator transcription factor [Runella aurantiaca]RDB05544.1 DNA-binding response regulator [Runella aurantiaca]